MRCERRAANGDSGQNGTIVFLGKRLGGNALNRFCGVYKYGTEFGKASATQIFRALF
jgi:hypothetical protein